MYSFPSLTNGASTGILPNQVKIMTVPVWNQNNNLFKGWNRLPLTLYEERKGKIKIIPIEKTKKTTPPNLLGIDRRIA